MLEQPNARPDDLTAALAPHPTDPPEDVAPTPLEPDPLVRLSDVATISEAARLIGAAPQTVWNWMDQGRIVSHRLTGRSTLVVVSQVRAEDARVRRLYPITRRFQPGYRPARDSADQQPVGGTT